MFKMTWLGHASFALEIDGYKVLLDPFLTGNPKATADPDALEADFILISHGHGDHVGDAVNIAKRTGALVIANNEIAGWFKKQGVENTHGQHIGGSQLPDGSDGGNPAGFLITLKDGKKVYFACDTGLFYSMKLYGDEGIDLAVLPIGDNYTMGPDDAFLAVELLRPSVVIPVHFNTWGVIEQDAGAWVDRVNAETDTEAVLLDPGDSYTLE
jgi:L-ascorbate metabolism protein UlaG (beta-lactamase superfamily)